MNNEIIPGVRVGEFFIFWVDNKTNKIFQIGVKGDFKGKFQGKIGLGSTLLDVQKYIGEWRGEFDVYVLPEYPGICFELKDIDHYDEE